MSFLIAKIFVLLLLAAAFGAWFSAWWVRRRTQDVTVEHTSLRNEWSAWRTDVDKRLATPPDHTAITQRLSALDATVRGIHIPTPPSTDLTPVLDAVRSIRIPQPERVDLAPLATRLAALEERMAGLRFPQPSAAPDLGPLQARLEALHERVAAIHLPAPAPAPDLTPLQAGLQALHERVAGLRFPAPAAPTDLAPLQAGLLALQQRVEGLRFPEPAAPADLGPLQAGLHALQQRVAGIVIPPAAREVDFAPLLGRMESVEQALRAIRIPEPARVDLQPLAQEVHGLRERVAALRMPEIPAMPPIPPAPDLAPLQRQLDALAAAVATLPRSMPQAAAATIDLAPTHERLGRVEQALRAIVIPPAADLGGVSQRLRELEQRVASLRMPEPVVVPATDLGPLVQRLDALADQVRELRSLRAAPAPVVVVPSPSATPPAAKPSVRAGSRNLLTRAAHGKPDDLKRIKGVAEVLEGMLHRVGVYYFWQVAEWDAADIEYVDRQLTAFKGRIKRDEWVAQSRKFLREGGVAVKPVDA